MSWTASKKATQGSRGEQALARGIDLLPNGSGINATSTTYPSIERLGSSSRLCFAWAGAETNANDAIQEPTSKGQRKGRQVGVKWLKAPTHLLAQATVAYARTKPSSCSNATALWVLPPTLIPDSSQSEDTACWHEQHVKTLSESSCIGTN